MTRLNALGPAEIITARIIDRLEAGVMPWVRPWVRNGGPLRFNGVRYRGINALYLGLMADLRGYTSPYWLTGRQATEEGGQVRRGERPEIAVFYSRYAPREAGGGRLLGDAGKTGGRRAFMRAYQVYSADQCDGLPERFMPATVVPGIPSSSDDCDIEGFFKALPGKVRWGGNEAFYATASDRIQMPSASQFHSHDLMWSTLAHEYVHWSGAKHRLDRNLTGRFGSESYAAEELVACIGQAVIGAELGLPDGHIDNHASYIDSWIRVLRQDSRALLTAAAKAEEACDYLFDLADRQPAKGGTRPDQSMEGRKQGRGCRHLAGGGSGSCASSSSTPGTRRSPKPSTTAITGTITGCCQGRPKKVIPTIR